MGMAHGRFGDPLAEVLSRLQGVKQHGARWAARCPAHEDKHPSLSVGVGKQGQVLLYCHAGCDTKAILLALDITYPDLWPANGETTSRVPAPPDATALSWEMAVARACSGRDCQGVWIYRLADGSDHMAVLRIDLGDGAKSYRQLSATSGSRWRLGAPTPPRPLFMLPEVLAGQDPVYVAEGERCVEALVAMGLTATTSPGGSQAAQHADWSPLAGRQVIILPDNDAPGHAYAVEVATILASLSPPARVCELRLPNLPPKGDVVDWAIQRHRSGLEIGPELVRLTAKAQILGPIVETPSDVVERWLRDGPDVHLSTGFQRIDDQTGGGPIFGSRWYLVGAPDAGKTALIIQLADHFVGQGVPVGILAIDEESDDVTVRLLQRRGHQRWRIEKREDGDVMRADADGCPIRIYGAEWTIDAAADDLASSTGGMKSVLFIDSIQAATCQAEKAIGTLYEKVTLRTKAIRLKARQHRMLMVTTSEMGRDYYRSTRDRNALDDLASAKESGAIEYTARVQLTLRSVPGEANLIELRFSKNKHGSRTPDGKPGIFLRLDRAKQELGQAEYTPPQDRRSADAEHRGRQQVVADAAHLAVAMVDHPGMNSRGLRSAGKLAAGSMSVPRVDTAMAKLGPAVVIVSGARGSLRHYLLGSAVPADVLAQIPVSKRAEVEAATPPEPQEEKDGDKRDERDE